MRFRSAIMLRDLELMPPPLRKAQHRRFRCAAQSLLGILLLGWSGVASAAPKTQARLQVVTALECASFAAIAAGVHQRNERVELLAQGEQLVQLLVNVHAGEGGAVQAELRVRWPDGRSAERSLAADSCKAAVSAVALLISATLDPSMTEPAGDKRAPRRAPAAARAGGPPKTRREEPAAEGGDAERAGEEAPRTNDAPPAAESAPEGPVAEPAAPAAESGGAQPQTASEPVAPAADGGEAAAPGPWAFDAAVAGATAQLASGVAPRLLPGLGGYLGVGLRGPSIWWPALRLAVSHAWLSAYAADGGVAAFRLTSVAAELCPVRFGFGPLALRACGSLQLGSLYARGSHTYLPAARARFWSALGISVPLELTLARYAQLVLQPALRMPTRRDRYAFAPDVFHRVGLVTFELQLGAGVHFP